MPSAQFSPLPQLTLSQLAPKSSSVARREIEPAAGDRRALPSSALPERVETFLHVLLNAFSMAGV